jgi:hypothetical protein
MKEKEVVTIMKKWNSPEIKMWVNTNEIALQIKLEDYLEAVSMVSKNVMFTFTKDGLFKLLKIASDVVVADIKKESVKVV